MLFAIEADVTNLAVEGLISNDDVDGRMYTVIASSIKAAAGGGVEQESVSQGPFELGQAWSTDAGALPSPYRRIIHVASMDRRGRTSLEIVRKCVRSALDEAWRLKLNSIGIAAFGTGPGATALGVVDIDEWLRAVGPDVAAYIDKLPTEPERAPLSIIIVVYEPDGASHIVALKRAVARWSATASEGA